jgi:hypothetical protein
LGWIDELRYRLNVNSYKIPDKKCNAKSERTDFYICPCVFYFQIGNGA